MAIFSGKVVTGKFLDFPNNMIIEILYKEGEHTVPYILEVDFTKKDFNDLLEEISLEDIENNTKKLLEHQNKIFNDMIEAEINRRIESDLKNFKETTEEYRSHLLNNQNSSVKNLTGKEIFNYLVNMNEDKDFVFDLKLGILEDPIVLKSKDKELKLSIRKSKSALELIKLYEDSKKAI